MTKFLLFVGLALFLLFPEEPQCQTCSGGNCTAASCNTSDVQSAINSTSPGATTYIPAGSCAWTTGVNASGINIVGAGTSRVIAISSTTLSLSTGTQTLTVQGTNVSNPAPSITTGESLTIAETGNEGNYLTGTVSSYNSSTGSLVMNVSNIGGTCGNISTSNCSRWLVTIPANPSTQTIIQNNDASNTPLFNLTESTSNTTSLSNFFVNGGTALAHVVYINYTNGGQPTLIHDCRLIENPNATEPPSGNADMITGDSNRGVVWNCSFDSNPFNLSTMGAVTIKDDSNVTKNSWTSVSNMGSLDTNGQGEFFVESNDFHAFGFANGNDDNGRMVVRYNLYNNSGIMGTHGADTSNYGQRYFEAYNNVGVFNAYTNGTTFNLNDWIYLRGGTGLIYDNTLPALTSEDYGNKPDINMTVMNLQRSAGPDPCWGASFSSAGQYYHAPRQVGFGYVTGSGAVSFRSQSSNPALSVVGSLDSITYVGDSEPVYIWGNSRSPLNVAVSDYGGTNCANPDSSANYIQSGRDYFNGSTAKPGWSAYTYPHPLRNNSTGTTSKSPAAPTSLTATPSAQ